MVIANLTNQHVHAIAQEAPNIWYQLSARLGSIFLILHVRPQAALRSTNHTSALTHAKVKVTMVVVTLHLLVVLRTANISLNWSGILKVVSTGPNCLRVNAEDWLAHCQS